MKVTARIRVILCMLVLSMIFVCVPVTIFAAEQTGSISVVYELDDVKFDIFKIGEIQDGTVQLTQRFSEYRIDLQSEDAAQTLEAYILRDGVASDKSVYTNRKTAIFNKLGRGIYLVLGQSSKVGNVTYTVMPSIISLPYDNEGKDEWNVSCQVKFSKDDEPEKYTSVGVQKVWVDSETKVTHSPILVQLLRNNKPYDTVELSNANNWKYVWKNLETAYTWRVVEYEIPVDYVVSVRNTSYNMYVITNRDNPKDPPDNPQTDPTTPVIPQTGQLNWPVPIFSILGVLLLIIGVAIRNQRNIDRE